MFLKIIIFPELTYSQGPCQRDESSGIAHSGGLAVRICLRVFGVLVKHRCSRLLSDPNRISQQPPLLSWHSGRSDIFSARTQRRLSNWTSDSQLIMDSGDSYHDHVMPTSEPVDPYTRELRALLRRRSWLSHHIGPVQR